MSKVNFTGNQGLSKELVSALGKPGVFFAFYLFLYAFGRFWLEFLRIEPWRMGGINVAQGISGGLMIFSFLWLTKQR